MNGYGRSTGGYVLALDDPEECRSLNLAAATPGDSLSILLAIRQVYRKLGASVVNRILLVGGESVIPHFQLANPVRDRGLDPDDFVSTDNPYGAVADKRFAVANQYDLERIARELSDCSEKEKALSGAEDSIIASLNAEIDVLKKERDALQDSYLNYERSDSPLTGEFRLKLQQKEIQIRATQSAIRDQEQIKRERTRRSIELDRLTQDVSTLLAEPGRLRPKEKFDSFLSSLSTHIVGFLLLAFGWSILFEPINRAVFGIVYDNAFNDPLDLVWSSRNPRFPRPDAVPSRASIISVAVVVVVLALLLVFTQSNLRSSPGPDACTLQGITDCADFNRLIGLQRPFWSLSIGCLLSTAVGLCLAVLLSWLLVVDVTRRKTRRDIASLVIGVNYYLSRRGHDTYPGAANKLNQKLGVFGGLSATRLNSYFLGLGYEPVEALQLMGGVNFVSRNAISSQFNPGTVYSGAPSFTGADSWGTNGFVGIGFNLSIFRKIFGSVTQLGTKVSGTGS